MPFASLQTFIQTVTPSAAALHTVLLRPQDHRLLAFDPWPHCLVGASKEGRRHPGVSPFYNILCDYIESKNASTIMKYVMNESTGEIKFYVGSPTVPDATTNLVMTLQNNLITFHKPTSPDIGGGGVDDTNLVKYTGETLQTIEGDLVLGGGAQFGSFDLTVNGSAYFLSGIELVLGGTVVLGTGKGYIRSINIGGGNTAYDYCIFSSGSVHRFYVGGSPFPQHLKFQLSLTQAYFNVDVVCHTELQTDVINTKNATDFDLVFKRGDVEYMKFEGTLQAVELTKGAKSNTYDSIGNVDVKKEHNRFYVF